MREVDSSPWALRHAPAKSSRDAFEHPLPDQTSSVWFTDPPYYDAIPYSDLSDFFFVWLKRALPGHPLLRDPFDSANPLTPKTHEAVQDETKSVNGRPKDRRHSSKRRWPRPSAKAARASRGWHWLRRVRA